MILSSRAYEILRWVIAIILPAIIVFFDTLAKAWNWNIPVEPITTSLSALSLFLGTVFGISKLSFDKSQAEAELNAKKK